MIKKLFSFIRYTFCGLIVAVIAVVSTADAQTTKTISEDELRDKILGYWNGQLVGNFVGFPFENLYLDEPIPILIDRYFNAGDADSLDLMMNIDDRRAHTHIMADAFGGAWSDDDSDIEFVYLHAVETYGLDLTYENVATIWKTHINRFIWGANRFTRDLMEEGLIPPQTGSREHNERWYRISSQLVTEIWGVFYPGLTRIGGEKAQWAGHVSTDEWATHPDLFYGTMFSAAFFEKDVEKLILLGRDALPEDSPFRRGIDDIIRWHSEYPDWRDVRPLMHEKYYHEIDGFVVPTPYVGSIINGLSAVMALLYGEGEFVRTVAIATSIGYDCDNQAATLGGLLGIMHGSESIPEEFTHELPSRERWDKPFNDTYINYTRDELPAYNRISDIVERIKAISEQAIFLEGGRREVTPEGVVFHVPVDF